MTIELTIVGGRERGEGVEGRWSRKTERRSRRNKGRRIKRDRNRRVQQYRDGIEPGPVMAFSLVFKRWHTGM